MVGATCCFIGTSVCGCFSTNAICGIGHIAGWGTLCITRGGELLSGNINSGILLIEKFIGSCFGLIEA